MRKIRIHILVCVIILTGFGSVGVLSYITYSKIIKDDIKNISKLTATNIYSEISIQLTKPIFVGLTMANDSFVENWLSEEKSNMANSEHQMKMKEYLDGLRLKYNYNSVFLVSENSKVYYHFNGINKVISEKNQHDQWYYDYLKSKLLYDLDVDTDEANHNALSVFVNCRIEDMQGKLLGVTGVGLELNKVQDLLSKYQEDFQLEAMLFDKKGIVQIHSNTELIEKINVFDNQSMQKNKASILGNKETVAVYYYKDKKSEGYMITKYIEDLDWYLLIKKDTAVLSKSFQASLFNDIIIFLAVLFLILIIIAKLIKSNDESLRLLAKMDTLTGLKNRSGFDEALEKILINAKGEENGFIFVIDVDNFKNINDKYGHLTGDTVLCFIVNIVKRCLKEYGDVFRWGGDEFTGYILLSRDKLEGMLGEIFRSIENDTDLKKYSAGISMGITPLVKDVTVDDHLKKADKALYLAKKNGKNKYLII